MAFSLLGNFSGPVVCGWVAKWTGMISWGIRSVIIVGMLGCIPLVVCVLASRDRQRASVGHAEFQDRPIEEEKVHPEEDELTDGRNQRSPNDHEAKNTKASLASSFTNGISFFSSLPLGGGGAEILPVAAHIIEVAEGETGEPSPR